MTVFMLVSARALNIPEHLHSLLSGGAHVKKVSVTGPVYRGLVARNTTYTIRNRVRQTLTENKHYFKYFMT